MKPFYIERGGEQAPPQPYQINQVTMYSFLLDADKSALQKLCDKYLNQVSENQTDYKPLLDKVFLIFSIQKEQWPANSIGWIPEIDVGFWVLTYATNPFRIRFFQPYLFVDSGYATAAGREIYGFHKILGRFQIPELDQLQDYMTVDTIVSRGATVQAGWERLIQVTRKAGENKKTFDWSSPEEVIKKMFGSLLRNSDEFSIPGFGFGINLMEHFIDWKVGMVFLKQFRDIENPKLACYQAINEASANPGKVRQGGFLIGDYELELNSYFNFPIAQELGLKEGKQKIQESFWIDFDFVMETGKIIWENNNGQ